MQFTLCMIAMAFTMTQASHSPSEAKSHWIKSNRKSDEWSIRCCKEVKPMVQAAIDAISSKNGLEKCREECDKIQEVILKEASAFKKDGFLILFKETRLFDVGVL